MVKVKLNPEKKIGVIKVTKDLLENIMDEGAKGEKQKCIYHGCKEVVRKNTMDEEEQRL